MTELIIWTNVTVKLSQLIPWEDNPKTSTAKNAKQLQTSKEELGQFQTVAIEPTDKPDKFRVADGHQRLNAWLLAYGKDSEIDARLASRELTEQERRKVAIYSRQIGAWDWDILSSWEPEELMDWGFDADTLSDWGRDYSNLAEMLGAGKELDESYTKKIEAPTYTPTGYKPELTALFNSEKTEAIVKNINDAANVQEDVKEFLRRSAQRHTVFHFKNIAEYYAHAPEEVQLLMEESALVIIDFNKAVEYGYIELTAKISDMVKEAYGDE